MVKVRRKTRTITVEVRPLDNFLPKKMVGVPLSSFSPGDLEKLARLRAAAEVAAYQLSGNGDTGLGATPERLGKAQGDFDVGNDKQGGKIYTFTDDVLARTRKRGVIDARQYAAIDKFRHHWHHGGLTPTVGSVDLNRIFAPDLGSFSGMAKSERQVFHRQRYREAVQKMGMRISNVVERIACMDEKIEVVGRSLGWSHPLQARASASEMLITGGDILADLWMLPHVSR